MPNRLEIQKSHVIRAVVGTGFLISLCLIIWIVSCSFKSLARVDYPDGSGLSVEEATFGTNHFWHRGSWDYSVRQNGFFATCWEALRNQFRPALDKNDLLGSLQFPKPQPGICLWGSWDGAGKNHGVFRFIVVDDEGHSLATFQNFQPELGQGHGYGLLAILTNPPAIRQYRIHIIEDTKGKPKGLKSGFIIKNKNDPS